MNEQVHEKTGEAKDTFLEAFTVIAEKENPWLAAVWSLDGDQITITKTSMRYPKREYLQSLLLLKGILDNEISQTLMSAPKPEPLPTLKDEAVVPVFPNKNQKTPEQINEEISALHRSEDGV